MIVVRFGLAQNKYTFLQLQITFSLALHYLFKYFGKQKKADCQLLYVSFNPHLTFELWPEWSDPTTLINF